MCIRQSFNRDLTTDVDHKKWQMSGYQISMVVLCTRVNPNPFESATSIANMIEKWNENSSFHQAETFEEMAYLLTLITHKV